MKVLPYSFLLAGFFVLLGLSPAPALTLDQGLTRAVLDSSQLQVYVDRDSATPADEILSGGERYFETGAKNTYPYSAGTIWTRVSLTNGSDQPLTLHLLNDFVAHDQLDLYLIESAKLIKAYRFGDTRQVAAGEVINRFANVHIELAAHQTLEVVTRYHSTSPVHIKMILLDEAGYARFAVTDLSIWGIFIGALLALAIYNLMMFASLRNVAFLYYVLNSLTNLYNTLTGSGYIYAWLSPWLPLPLLNLSYNKIAPPLGIIFMSLFIISFFELKKRCFWLYRMNLANAVIIAILLISLPLFHFSEKLLVYNWISSLLLPLSLLVMLVSALVIAWKKLFGGVYFLLGAGLFFVATLCYILYFVGLTDFPSSIIYALPLSRAAEAIFFSMALGKKIKMIEAERLENALLVEESNKFNSTSSLLAGILHQFKQPLIYLGSELLNLRAARFKAGLGDHQTERSLEQMEAQVTAMNTLVGNFYSFYAQQTRVEKFALRSAIDKVTGLLDSSLRAWHIELRVNCDADTIRSDEKALTQILLILLENAIAVLQERQVEHPQIRIDCRSGAQVEILVSDNGGGIVPGDIDKIFNLHYSKKQARGLGIGLSLARKLVEDKLDGRLSVKNHPEGACFFLTF